MANHADARRFPAILRAAGIIPPGVVQYVPETNAAKKEEQEEEDDDDDVDKAEAEIAALQVHTMRASLILVDFLI